MFSSSDFAALDDLVAKLQTGQGADVRAALTTVNAINDELTISYGAMAGRIAEIDSQRAVIEDTTFRLDELLMREEDLDYATAVTELTQESVALQGSQASFVKLSQLSLFNYL